VVERAQCGDGSGTLLTGFESEYGGDGEYGEQSTSDDTNERHRSISSGMTRFIFARWGLSLAGCP